MALTSEGSDEHEFRARCRDFLARHAHRRSARTDRRANDPVPDETAELAACKTFQRTLIEAGLAGLIYPECYGGAGMTKRHEQIWREEAADFDLPTRLLAISHGMCLPVLAEFGTNEQRSAYLPRLISAQDLWCQMFSEPGAGSDVASLQTRAIPDGDSWVLNGQKVWTTYAHLCDYGLVVARTNVDVPKHRGLSMFVVRLDTPGVEIRPLRQLTGNADFNEVFFSDVQLPADALVGEVDDGWRVATTMLMHERVSIGSGRVGGVTHARADALIELARRHGRAGDHSIRQRLASVYAHEITSSLLALTTHAARQAGRPPGPGGSLGKLKGAILAAKIRELTFELLGPDATAWETDEGRLQVERALTSIGASIAGGTNEIQRNIIGERVLGLPAEPSVDKNVPFKDVAVTRLRA